MIRISLYGALGFSTARTLWQLHKDALENRFSRRFLRAFQQPETDAAATGPSQGQAVVESNGSENAAGVFRMYDIGEGGLFGTLWQACEDVSEGSEAGCEVDLARVPVRQEVVEICELYDTNPYEVPSEGCCLVLWDDEREEQIPEECLRIIQKSAMIGRLTRNRQRIVTMYEHVRFLTPPERQKKDVLDRTGRKEVPKC